MCTYMRSVFNGTPIADSFALALVVPVGLDLPELGPVEHPGRARLRLVGFAPTPAEEPAPTAQKSE